MNIDELVNNIKNNYQQKNYAKVIELMSNYFSNNYGVYGIILDMYMNSLIELGRFEEASSVLTAINKLFPDYNNTYYSSSKYLMCNEVEKAEEILLKDTYNADTAYNLGKVYSLEGRLDEAKKCFMDAANKHNDEKFRNKAREELIKISNYYRLGSFITKDYKYFKKHGGKLREQDVIYVKNVSDKYNKRRLVNDKKIINKPYLIWRIVGNSIYAFPMSLMKDADYTLFASKYPNININRYINSYLVLINESDVCKIYDHIYDEDFKNILNSVYHTMCRINPMDLIENKVFMDSMMRKIEVKQGSILNYYNFLEKRYVYYYVIDMDVDSYKVVEISSKIDNYKILSDVTTINRDNYIYDVFEEEQSIKDEINKNIANKNKIM